MSTEEFQLRQWVNFVYDSKAARPTRAAAARATTARKPAQWRHGFVEASLSRVLRDGEGMFRVTVIEATQFLEVGSELKYFGTSERIGE